MTIRVLKTSELRFKKRYVDDRHIQADFDIYVDFGEGDEHDPEEAMQMSIMYDIEAQTLSFDDDMTDCMMIPMSKINEFVEWLKRHCYEVN